MANRAMLHKAKLEEFKEYLNARGIGHRPGKGAWQKLQVLTPKYGWQCIHSRVDMPEHYTIQDKLTSLVWDYLKEKRKETGK
jgi:hypothetical protein